MSNYRSCRNPCQGRLARAVCHKRTILTRHKHNGVSRALWAILQTPSAGLSHGGGFAAVPLFQHEAVLVHHWPSTRQFLDGIALGQVTPGSVMITATFVGYRVFGVLGAIVGTLAVLTPSCLAVFLLAQRQESVSKALWAQAMIKGIVAGFIGILAFVIVHLAGHSLVDWKTVALFLAALAVLLFGKKDPLWVVLGGAILSPILFS